MEMRYEIDDDYEVRRSERRMRWERRRQKEKQRRMRVILSGILVVGIFVLFLCSFHSNAQDVNSHKYKYYTCVTVSSGDTLWKIATQYADLSVYRNKLDFIEEVKSINHLEEDGKIRTGEKLIVPYYSSEYFSK